MKRYEVYANGTLVDNFEQVEGYTAEDYREDCRINGWEFAPCSEDDEIELFEVEDNEEDEEDEYPTREEMWNFVNAGLITEEAILAELKTIEGVKNPELTAERLAKMIEEDDLDGYGMTRVNSEDFTLIEEPKEQKDGSYAATCIKLGEDGLYRATWKNYDEAFEIDEDSLTSFAETVERL